MKDELAAIFGPRGLLSTVFDKYEHRPGQGRMAALVERALREDHLALIEAPTGTGKTIAYLIPVLQTKRRVVISTGTKALQEQIIRKDIPLAERVLGREIRAVIMKGRRNYLCRYRLALFLQQPVFDTRQESSLFRVIERWSATTETGDRAEIDELPDDCAVWRDICSTPESCAGQRCSHNATCFITKLRQRAAAAEAVVTNHHLLFADLAVRMNSGGEGQVLPDYSAVICDEAHQLEDTATSYFGLSTSSYRFDEWERDLTRTLTGLHLADAEIPPLLGSLRQSRDRLFEFYRHGREDRSRLTADSCTREIADCLVALRETADRLAARLSTLAAGKNILDLEALARRIKELAIATDEICIADDPAFVYWREARPRSVILHKDPIELGPAMQDSLFAYTTAVVFTSATLTTQGSFKYIKNRLGIAFDTIEESLPTCFDYPRQGLLYLPTDLPEPNEPAFIEAAIARIEQLVRAAGGRSFCLFTSIRNMEAAYQALRPRLPYPCMLQGEAPKHVLLERKRREPTSVLFATASFWEGVDIAGDALGCVIIDKLPFASPGEPIVAARIEKLTQDGGQAFLDYQLPAAIIMLKQGLGRLIRASDDRGILAILDSRLQRKGYGKQILGSLPSFAKTSKMDDVLRFWQTVASI